MNRIIHSIIITFLILLLVSSPGSAQTAATGPVYIVQSGDTLNIIASRFGVSPADIIAVNNLTNPDILSAGSHLTIPGLDGISGILTTTIIPLGQSLASISHEYQVPIETLVRLNHLSIPSELYAGASLIIPQTDSAGMDAITSTVESGQSYLDLAIKNKVNPWVAVRYNSLPTIWRTPASENLYFPINAQEENKLSSFHPLINSITISPLPLTQGNTVEITITTKEAANFSGSLNDKELHFFSAGENKYSALQGVHSMASPGLTSFQLKGQFVDGQSFEFEQMLLLSSGYFPQDPPLYVEDETIDPAVTKPEEDFITSIITQATPERYWVGTFLQPVDEPVCIKSWYGNRRSYNGSDYTYFHTGVDYGVCANLNIYAAAPGRVVFTGMLTVRGNATIIDHGWGVYSAYYHQSQTLVSVGDTVEAGQKIGEIGKTGRVTGPHLHWEIWVNGIQVEPLDWIANTYPAD